MCIINKEGVFAKFLKKFKKEKKSQLFFSDDYNVIAFTEKLLGDVTKWKFFAVVLLIILGVVLFKGNTKDVGSYKDFVAVIEIDGIIQTDSYRTKILEKLAENKGLRGVFLKINSPGGTITGSEILYNEIKRLREIVPVYSLIYDLGASGAYMTAIASTQIFAHESSITGSIGVLMQSIEAEEFANKIGARIKTYRSSIYKGQPDTFQKATPEIEQYMKEAIDVNYKFFANMVAKERKISPEQLPNVANGKIFSGEQALALNLIDGIATESIVKKKLEEKLAKKYEFVDVSLKEEEKMSIISQMINDILSTPKESLYGTKVMAVMKL